MKDQLAVASVLWHIRTYEKCTYRYSIK